MADDFDFGRARRVLERIPREVDRELKDALKKSGQDFKGAMYDRFTGYSNPRTAGDRLQNRGKGAGLREAIGFDVLGSFGSGRPLALLAFTAGKPYARIQEFGGEVRPVRSRFLTIPANGNLTPGGGVRYSSARDFIQTHPGETFFLRTKSGARDSLLLMWNKPNPASRKSSGVKDKGEAIPMFFLTRKVTIPPRLGFRRTWNALAPDRVSRIREALSAAVKAAGSA